jgi:hypothetical protein
MQEQPQLFVASQYDLSIWGKETSPFLRTWPIIMYRACGHVLGRTRGHIALRIKTRGTEWSCQSEEWEWLLRLESDTWNLMCFPFTTFAALQNHDILQKELRLLASNSYSFVDCVWELIFVINRWTNSRWLPSLPVQSQPDHEDQFLYAIDNEQEFDVSNLNITWRWSLQYTKAAPCGCSVVAKTNL